MMRAQTGCKLVRATLGAVLLLGGPVAAADVLRYDFAGTARFIVDRSGGLHHGLAHNAARVTDEARACLRLGEEGYVRMPEAALVLGEQPDSGAIELSVKPDFDPRTLPTGTWEGWVVLVYFQKTSGNGLPDGYNEIGLALHGPKLLAKVVGGDELAPFAVIDTPLEQGKWTRLRLEWSPVRRVLLVDGRVAVERTGQFATPRMDMFPAYVGRHPASGRWGFTGLVADVSVQTAPR